MPIAVSRSTVVVGVCLTLAVLVLLGQRLAHAGAASKPEVVAAELEPVAEADVETQAGAGAETPAEVGAEE